MSEWTKQRLEQMIADGVEESLSLEYKRSDSLAKTDPRRSEITKDVSSFANSSGGMLIYGIAEFAGGERKHLPERLDPVKRTEISKEWLDQVIQTIQPKIEGLVIHPITISDSDNTVCYVVEIPQSHTAHMARDHRYYKRQNFTTTMMEDYEVRDVMNRRKHPQIQGFVFVNRNVSSLEPQNTVLMRFENIGAVIARHFMAELELPLNMGGVIIVGPTFRFKETDEGICQVFRLPSVLTRPLFPGSSSTSDREFTAGGILNDALKRRVAASTRQVKVSIFADEMPPIRTTLDIGQVLAGWTPVHR